MAYAEHPRTVVVHEDEHTFWAVVARRVVLFLLDVLEILLAFRFFLKLLAANPASPFVQFIYAATQPFVYPFQGIFPQPSSQGSVLEWSVLLAMVVYALVGWGTVRLIWLLSAHEEPVEQEPVAECPDVERHDDDTMV